MSNQTVHILKACVFVGLFILLTGLPLGNSNLSFGETPDTDIVMTIDGGGSSGEEAQMLNHVMNVVAAAFVWSEGNLEIVVRDRHELCLSAVTDHGGCSRESHLRSKHVMTDGKSNDQQIIIHAAYDE